MKKEKKFLKRINKKVVYVILGILGLPLFLLFTFYLSILMGLFGPLPGRAELKAIKNHTASEVYSSDNVLIGKYYIQDRSDVSYDDLPQCLVDALIATEDSRFYSHSGIDIKSLFRVMIKSILMQNESSGGGSTLSQQLAKNLFPRKDYSYLSMPINKTREMILASKLEEIYPKNDILTLYLNTVPFAENAFGIGSASHRFFNKKVKDLNVDEAAILIGMLKATSYYNPKRNPERALERRNAVIGQMLKYEYLTEEDAKKYKEKPLKLNYVTFTHNDGIATYFREFLRQEVSKEVGGIKKPDGTYYNLYTDGLKIYTTLDSRLQNHAEQAVKEHMSQLQLTFYKHWGKAKPWGKNEDVIIKAVRRTPRYKKLAASGMTDAEIKKIFSTPVPMKIFTWNGEVEKNMSPLDSIIHYQYFLHAALMAMDPATGAIKAWVGGLNHKHFQYDHVNINTKRQVGSTFKPIVYAAALEKGIEPCTYIPNEKITFTEFENWSPRNSDNNYGGFYSMEGGLNKSVNTITAHLISQTGVNPVIDMAQKMGIVSDLEPVPSIALGASDISLFEMTGLYGTFANRGIYTKPSYLVKITDKDGKVIKEFNSKAEQKRVMKEENADILIHILKSVVNKGTAGRLRYQYQLKNDIAGKTGTTQSHADGWFMGFTPNLVAGVWVGAEDRRVHFRSIDLGQGANMALPIWGKFMQKVNNDPKFKSWAAQKFPSPSEVVMEKLNCELFLEELVDENEGNGFWKIFKLNKSDKKERESKKHAPENGASTEKNNPFEKIRNLFKRK